MNVTDYQNRAKKFKPHSYRVRPRLENISGWTNDYMGTPEESKLSSPSNILADNMRFMNSSFVHKQELIKTLPFIGAEEQRLGSGLV